jgi:hypothetical protein
MLAYKVYKFYTVDDAIHIMMKDTESNKFLHKFMSENNTTCDICSASLKDHIEYIEDQEAKIKSTLNLSVINIQVNPDIFDEPDMCKICYANNINEVNRVKFDCGHEFCKDCMINYLRIKIVNGKVRYYNTGYGYKMSNGWMY